MLYEKLYKSIPRRILMRAIEIFLVSGVIGVLNFGLEVGWFSALWTGVVAAVLKALREWRDRKKNV